METGEYSDPRTTEWIVKCLIERRNKIEQAWFSRVLPLDKFRANPSVRYWRDRARNPLKPAIGFDSFPHCLVGLYLAVQCRRRRGWCRWLSLYERSRLGSRASSSA